MKRCAIDSCNNKHSAKGFCNVHYQRHIRNIPMEGNKKTTKERIYEKIKKQKNGCWIWTGARSGGDGRDEYKYGYINIDKKAKRVHRILYEIEKNIILSPSDVAQHTCDTPLCVNPDHIIIGTHLSNMRDMIAKNRAKHPCGEENNSKLSSKDVLHIRNAHMEGQSLASLASRYKVHHTTISNIVKRKKWKHL